MIASKYFSLAVFLMFLATLETLHCDGMRFNKREQIRHMETNDKQKGDSDQLEDIYLAQKFPFMFGTVINKDSSKVQINKKRSFIIDGRPSKLSISQTSVQEQKINVIIKLLGTKHLEIGTVIKQLFVQKQQWNQDKGQFQSSVFGVDQLTMDRHNQFYSILLPTLENGKYRVIIEWKQNNDQPLDFSIVFYLINLSNSNQNSLTSNQPAEMSVTEDMIILPFGQTFSVPISSPNDVMMVELQSCSFSIPSIFYSLNDISQMQELKDHDKKSTIFLINNLRTPYNPSIYLKYINSPQVYFQIQPSQQSLEKGKIVQPSQFQQHFVRINKNTKTHFKNTLTTNQQFSSQISYQIKGTDIEITYKRVYPNKNALLSSDQNPLSKTKIVYKLYLSPSQSALAKKSLCGMDTYQQGKNVIVMQKVIEEQYISELIQKTQQKQTQNGQNEEFGITKISLWDIRKSFQNADSQLYVNMKVSIITTQKTSISSQISESQKLSSQKVASSNEIFYYEPMKVKLVSSDIWLFIWDLKFSKLMWVFIIISLCILFVLFFFQSLCKGWISRKKIPNESISPRIVIRKPKKSLSDSYGFYPSPPGSSNIIKIYESSGSDQIIENGQRQQQSEDKLEISNQLISPPLV